MKTLPSLAFLAAFVAFVLLPLPFETAGMMLFAVGFAAIAMGDYARTRRPLWTLRALPATATMRVRRERFGLAA